MEQSANSDAPALLDLVSSFHGPSPAPSPASTAEAYQAQAHPRPTASPAATTTATTDDGCFRHATVIVFSKDRPWQLQQLLRSMDLSSVTTCAKGTAIFQKTTIDVKIIAKIDEEFDEGYRMVEEEFEYATTCNNNADCQVSVTFLREDNRNMERSSFEHLLESIIITPEHRSSDQLLMFLTDDCLCLQPLQMILSCAASCLYSHPRALSFLSRLHPGITWCQTRNEPCPPPRDEMRFVPHCDLPGQTNLAAYIYDRKIGVADWSYPFDLSGGIYRWNHAMAILDWIREQGTEKNLSIHHPNLLEVSGNVALSEAEKEDLSELSSIVRTSDLNGASTQPLLVILAINRVQNVCSAPIAINKGSDEDSLAEYDSSSLLQFLQEDKQFDIDAYRSSHFNSSHIGQMLLLDKNKNRGYLSASDEENASAATRISVLIPVHEGPPKYAQHALRSILMQPLEEYEEMSTLSDGTCALRLSPMQIVIVDDRCVDGSIDSMTDMAKTLTSNPNVSLVIRDRRQLDLLVCEKEATSQAVAYGDGKIPVKISVDIVLSKQKGVASALNYGLKYCTSDIVARMDADDVSSPRRLLSQVLVLQQQPELDVVGTSSCLFSGQQKNHTGTRRGKDGKNALPYGDRSEEHLLGISILRSSLPSSDPGFVCWSMLFSCCLSHPSTMFRKEAIEQIGGYDENIVRGEDYDLWHRLLQKRPRSICSLPNIGLFHRKHPGSSTSGNNSKKQDSEAKIVSLKAMQSILLFDNSSEQKLDMRSVAVMKKPNDAENLPEINSAAVSLVALEKSFLQKCFEILTEREKSLIRLDCDARIGELATLAVSKFGRKASTSGSDDNSSRIAWDIWCKRCPEKNLERISLLCHAM